MHESTSCLHADTIAYTQLVLSLKIRTNYAFMKDYRSVCQFLYPFGHFVVPLFKTSTLIEYISEVNFYDDGFLRNLLTRIE